MKTAKLALSFLAVAIFSGAMVGCEASGSVDTDHSSTSDNGSTYKKTTYTDSNGNTSTKTEKSSSSW